MVETSPSWVFGYGSLIWRPGFEFFSAQGAYLCGYHRSLCIYSHKYRGTPSKPGLVFGLVPGGCCEGRAFEVAPERWEEVHAYLQEREGPVYHEVSASVRLADGRSVSALTFVADERHEQYAGRLDWEAQLRLVRQARGETGSNRDYVLNTVRHLAELGIADRYLTCLQEKLQEHSLQDKLKEHPADHSTPDSFQR